MKIAQKYTGHGQHKNHNRGCVQQNVIYSIGEMISCVLLILKFYFQYRYLCGVHMELSILCTY